MSAKCFMDQSLANISFLEKKGGSQNKVAFHIEHDKAT